MSDPTTYGGVPVRGLTLEKLARKTLSNTFYVENHGAKGDGSTDDTDAWQAAVSAAETAGSGIVTSKGPGPYVINGRVLIVGDNITVVVNGELKRTSSPGNDWGLIEIMGTETTVTAAVTSTALVGDTSLSVSATAGFAVDDWVQVESSATVGGINPYWDIHQVKSLAANTINLSGAMRQEFDAGSTLTVRKISVVKNSHIIGRSATVNHNIATDIGHLLRIRYGVGCSMQQFRGINHMGPAFRFERSVSCWADGLYPEDTGDGAGNGYGVQLFSSYDSVVRNCHGRANRHSFDIARGSCGNLLSHCTSRDDASDAFVMGHGQVSRNNRAEHCAAYAAGASGFVFGNSSYTSDHQSTASGCSASGCTSYGFAVRQSSTDTILEGCDAIANTGNGFRVEGSAVRTSIVSPYACENGTIEINVQAGPTCIYDPNVYKDDSGITIEVAAAECTIIGGSVRGDGTPSTGIRANAVDDVRVIGVRLDNFGTRGVLGSNANGLAVIGCFVDNCTTAIETSGTSENAVIFGNTYGSGVTTENSLTGSKNISTTSNGTLTAAGIAIGRAGKAEMSIDGTDGDLPASSVGFYERSGILYGHSRGSIQLGLDADNDSTTASFALIKDDQAHGTGGSTLFTITEAADAQFEGEMRIPDGITAPATATGYAVLYVDSADGDLKVKFGDGTVKTITADT
jgi:hypothetical protein